MIQKRVIVQCEISLVGHLAPPGRGRRAAPGEGRDASLRAMSEHRLPLPQLCQGAGASGDATLSPEGRG